MAGWRWLAGVLMRASRVWGRGGGCEAERWALLGAERDGSALRSRTIGASSEEGAGVSGRSRMEGPGIASRIEEAEARSAPCASSRTGSTSTNCWRARSHQMKRGEQQKGCHMGGSCAASPGFFCPGADAPVFGGARRENLLQQAPLKKNLYHK